MNTTTQPATDSASTSADTAKPVVFSFSINAGNERAGAKCSGKRITSLDLSKSKTCHGFIGDWLEEGSNVAPEGTLIVLGGRGGSWKNQTSSYILAKVQKGAELNYENGYQEFKGRNLELVESSGTYKGSALEEVIEEYPDLAAGVGGVVLPLFYEAALLLMPLPKPQPITLEEIDI